MSFEYRHTDESGDTLQFTGGDHGVLVESDPYVSIPDVDVPTIAAELLRAAGRSDLTEMIEAVEADRTARLERESTEMKLQARRDAVAAVLSEGRRSYGTTGLTAQAAIDRIIELEDKLASRD